MQRLKMATVVMIAAMFLLAGAHLADAAIRIVKFTVPSCE